MLITCLNVEIIQRSFFPLLTVALHPGQGHEKDEINVPMALSVFRDVVKVIETIMGLYAMHVYRHAKLECHS